MTTTMTTTTVVAQTPDWVKHAVFYQIFPDRFASSSSLPKPSNLEPWDAPATQQGYKGGDLIGVIEHLDHIQRLGATAIYFTPIFQSACNHRYHTHDYYQVDPLLGGNAALRALIDACHARNINVVLDGVFNHASRGFFQFSDILENGPHSAWLDWFTIEEWPLSAYDGDKPANYLAWVNNRALPKLNTDNPQVREFIMQVAEHWLRFGIDGWRLDVPFEIRTPGFWQEFRQRVKAINPDAYIVGEVWRDARQWLQGDQFDATMNYLFTSAAIAYAAGPRVVHQLVFDRSYDPEPAIGGSELADRLRDVLDLYPREIALAQLNLLDSHDTARLLNIAGGDAASVRIATILLMTFPGAPSIFYGDEIGLPGGQDPDCRQTMPWAHPERWDRAVLAYHTALIAIRHAHPALRTGEMRVVFSDDAVLVFVREDASETLLIGLNNSDEPRAAQFQLQASAITPLFGDGGAILDEATAALEIPARDGAIWLVQK